MSHPSGVAGEWCNAATLSRSRHASTLQMLKASCVGMGHVPSVRCGRAGLTNIKDDDMKSRKSPRLEGYDYRSAGYYFITFCTHEKQPTMGRIVNQTMYRSDLGNILERCWLDISKHYEGIQLDQYVVMPNHFHGILVIDSDKNKANISAVVGSVKAAASREFRRLSGCRGTIWQSSFHDHIIRDLRGLDKIREYIQTNPAKWGEDRFYR